MPAAVAVHEKNFHKDLSLSQQLISGCKALKYEDGAFQVVAVTIGVDSNCFFFFWTDQHRKSECLDLASIRDTRIGERKARLPRDPKLLQLCLIGSEREIPLEEKCMTLVCGNSYVDLRFISFIFAKRSEAHFWTNELFQLAYNYKTQCLSLERTLMKIYTRIKITSSPEVRISVKDIIQYFYADKDDRRRCEKALESHKNDPILLEKFQFKDFLRLFSQIVPRPDLEQVFVSLAGAKNVKFLTAEQVRDFLNRTQRDPRLNEILHPHATHETARLLIEKYEPQETFKQENRLSQEGFIRFLMSDSSTIVSPSCFTLHQDMNQPLAHYFVNSSHNTYLLGAQIKGRSCAEMYRQALLSGCRCVELDCWDGEDGEPIITHGRTLTVPITIKEALDAVADYAFKTSDFPVILSLENRCSARLQDKLARYLKRAFGPALLDQPLTSHLLEPGVMLPSPEHLRNRVLIKNKKRAPTVGPSTTISPQGDRNLPEESIANDSDTDDESDDVTETVVVEEENNQPATSPRVDATTVSMVETELSALVNYVQPTRFDSFEAAKKRNRGYECVSLVEDRAMMFLKKDPVHFIDFNKRQLTRIYPNATRVKSTNFLPFFFWSAGCQMVALNYQTPDLGMQLNTAVFEINGRSGYLLKPELMRRKDRTLDPFTESHLDGVVPASLSVKIISGLMLSFKRISSYVEVDMYGIFGDIDKKNHKTRVCQNNGMNPLYDATTQPFFFRVTLPEMAYLRISVREDRTGRLIGHALLPLNQIRPGYRHVVLRNEIGQTLPATMFIFIEVKDYIPTDQMDLANALENPIRHQNEHDRKEKLDELVNLVNDPEDLADNEMGGNDNIEIDSLRPAAASNGGPVVVETLPVVANPPKESTSSSPNKLPGPADDRVRRESAPTPSGTPHIKRASLVPSDPDDLAALHGLQEVKAQSVEDLKKTTKAIQKLCAKQDKALQKLLSKYSENVKRVEAMHTKEREKFVLSQEKARAVQEKRRAKTSNASLNQPLTNERDLDELIRAQESSRWDMLRKQGEQLVRLRRELHTRELELNKQYHVAFYQMLEEEMNLQRVVLNNRLQSVHDANVSKMMQKINQQASQELRELKTQKPPLSAAEIDQRHGDITQKSIRQGVSIAKKYETLFEDRKKVLAEEIDLILQRIKREKAQVERDLENKFEEKCRSLEEEMKKNTAPSGGNGDGDQRRSHLKL